MERASSAGEITPLRESKAPKIGGILGCVPMFYNYPEGYNGLDKKLQVKFESSINKKNFGTSGPGKW